MKMKGIIEEGPPGVLGCLNYYKTGRSFVGKRSGEYRNEKKNTIDDGKGRILQNIWLE